MKIKVISKDGFRIWLPVPLSVIKWKFIYRAGAKSKDAAAREMSEAIEKISGDMYRVLKEWKKKSGGEFVLVDVQSANGDIVKIAL